MSSFARTVRTFSFPCDTLQKSIQPIIQVATAACPLCSYGMPSIGSLLLLLSSLAYCLVLTCSLLELSCKYEKPYCTSYSSEGACFFGVHAVNVAVAVAAVAAISFCMHFVVCSLRS